MTAAAGSISTQFGIRAMDNNSLLPASFGEASQIALDDDDLVQAGATCLASPLAGATNGAAIRYEGRILQSILWKYMAHSASRD
jgi:hypothetical protein